MALTWGSLIVGGVMLIALPLAIFFMNTRRRKAGWWLLAAVAVLVIGGNLVEKIATGSSPLF